MKPFARHLAAGIAAAALLFSAAGAWAEEITLFAAASMTDAMTELSAAYTKAGGEPVKLAFASSSTLAKQIESGAPADVFISADQKWMDYLAERKLIDETTRRALAGNALVLIAPASAPFTIAIAPGFDLPGKLGDGRLAIGDPEHVPAGIYAKAALTKLGAWDSVAPLTVFAGDVRAALTFVETGEAAAGIVYATDAAISQKVVVAGTFPADSHDPIVYPIAAIAGHDRPEVKDFLQFLASDQAADVLRRYGFVVPAPAS